MLSEDGHRRIAAAIKTIDETSDGEVYCLIAAESSVYREVPLAWAAIVALVVPAIALMFGIGPDTLLALTQNWTAEQVTLIRQEAIWALAYYAMAQAFLFAITALVVSIPSVRRLMTPAFLKTHRVQRMAMQHFVSTGIHLPKEQPHILIYLSLAERRVEIVAGEAIHKIEGQALWDEARAAVIGGMGGGDPAAGIVKAIQIVGAPLAKHFPPTLPNVTADGVGEL
jgi:putative membrane protein